MTTTTHRIDAAEAAVPGLPRGGSGESFAVLNPATGLPLIRFSLATGVARPFATWSRTTPMERSQLLHA